MRAIQASSDPNAFLAFERDGWDRASEGYVRHFADVTVQGAEPTLDAASVGRGMRVLDLCTGPGVLAAAAVRRGAEVTEVDFSASAVEIARQRCPEARFVQADAQDLPFNEQSFDAILCGFGIVHLPDPAKALAEMRRVLWTCLRRQTRHAVIASLRRTSLPRRR